MSNISDEIENFILSNFYDDVSSISRNELACFFGVSPSQINYVLSTRFTFARGYLTESKRGGGGYVKIYRIEPNDDDYLKSLINSELNSSVTYNTAIQILENLKEKSLISNETMSIVKNAISTKSLKLPIDYEDELRAKIMRNILMGLFEGVKK